MAEPGQGPDPEGSRNSDDRKIRELTGLLRESLAASARGDHAESWSLTSRFATEFWLASPDDLPDGLTGPERTEFHVLRAAAADRMDLHDEAVAEIRAWRTAAQSTGAAGPALLALASLTLVAMTVECDDAVLTTTLPPSAALLHDLAGEISGLGARPDSDLTAEERVCLSLAAGAGLTCATSTEHTAMRGIFREFVDRFTTLAGQEGDRILTRAQQLHADGHTADAVDTVSAYLARLDVATSPTQVYEAHDMLGFFALTAGDTAGDMDAEGVLRHWRVCADLALETGAPLEGLHRAEQVCQLLNAEGDYDSAYELARRYDAALDGAPVGPALLNLRAVRARSALGADLPYEAFALAASTADWSALTGDDERTLACLSIAAMAAEDAGEAGTSGSSNSGETVVALLERAAALHLDRGEPVDAARMLRTAARERCSSGEFSRAVELMERALRVLEDPATPAQVPATVPGDDGSDMLTWHVADWNEDMSSVWEMADRPDLAVGYAERAARLFREARDHSGAALNWVSAAEMYLDQGDGNSCDRALDLAHSELTRLPGPAGGGEPADTGENAAWEGYLALRNLRQG